MMKMTTVPPTDPQQANKSVNEDRLLVTFKDKLDNVYPIHVSDVKSLHPGRHLTENIIRLWYGVTTSLMSVRSEPEKLHMFSSAFFDKLSAQIPLEEGHDKTSEAKLRHDAVKDLTENLNIFDLDFLLIPIVDGSNWKLAVVSCPDGKPRSTSENKSDGPTNPFILLFDSRHDGHQETERIFNLLKDFLEQEFKSRNGSDAYYPKGNLETMHPPVLKEKRAVDGALYFLHHMESFLGTPIKNSNKKHGTLYTRSFKVDQIPLLPEGLINGKRETIFNFITGCIVSKSPDYIRCIPSLKFRNGHQGYSDDNEGSSEQSDSSDEEWSFAVVGKFTFKQTQNSGAPHSSQKDAESTNRNPEKDDDAQSHEDETKHNNQNGNGKVGESGDAENGNDGEQSESGQGSDRSDDGEEQEQQDKEKDGEDQDDQEDQEDQEQQEQQEDQEDQEDEEEESNPSEDEGESVHGDIEATSDSSECDTETSCSSDEELRRGWDALPIISRSRWNYTRDMIVGADFPLLPAEEFQNGSDSDHSLPCSGLHMKTTKAGNSNSEFGTSPPLKKVKMSLEVFSQPPAESCSSAPQPSAIPCEPGSANGQERNDKPQQIPLVTLNRPRPIYIFLDVTNDELRRRKMEQLRDAGIFHLIITPRFHDGRITHYVPDFTQQQGIHWTVNVGTAILRRLQLTNPSWLDSAIRTGTLEDSLSHRMEIANVMNMRGPYRAIVNPTHLFAGGHFIFVNWFPCTEFVLSKPDLMNLIASFGGRFSERFWNDIEDLPAACPHNQSCYIIATRINTMQDLCNRIYERSMIATFSPNLLLHSVWTGEFRPYSFEARNFLFTSRNIIDGALIPE